jgi:hypothetical protein
LKRQLIPVQHEEWPEVAYSPQRPVASEMHQTPDHPHGRTTNLGQMPEEEKNSFSA